MGAKIQKLYEAQLKADKAQGGNAAPSSGKGGPGIAKQYSPPAGSQNKKSGK